MDHFEADLGQLRPNWLQGAPLGSPGISNIKGMHMFFYETLRIAFCQALSLSWPQVEPTLVSSWLGVGISWLQLVSKLAKVEATKPYEAPKASQVWPKLSLQKATESTVCSGLLGTLAASTAQLGSMLAIRWPKLALSCCLKFALSWPGKAPEGKLKLTPSITYIIMLMAPLGPITAGGRRRASE